MAYRQRRKRCYIISQNRRHPVRFPKKVRPYVCRKIKLVLPNLNPQDLWHGMKLCGESRNAPGKKRMGAARSRAGDNCYVWKRGSGASVEGVPAHFVCVRKPHTASSRSMCVFTVWKSVSHVLRFSDACSTPAPSKCRWHGIC